jgi:O-antigen/teichoic acid export membrane protein
MSRAPATLRTDSLVDSVLLLLALTVVQRLVGFVRAILFCRLLSPEQLGQWDIAFSFLMLAAPLSVLALSGSFGRYVEHYRQQGQFRTLVRRTALLVGYLAVMAWGVILLGRNTFSQLIFGTTADVHVVVLLAGSLVAVIAFHYMVDLFTGLRNARVLSGLQLLNGLAFAGFSLAMLATGSRTGGSMVIAYGAACLVSVLVALGPLRSALQACPDRGEPLPAPALWSKLVPFAAWMWVGSFLANLFDVADRYMIIHCPAFTADAALSQVGNYHSSRVVPLLLVSIASMVSTIVTPHLSHLWEQGRRDQVAIQLRMLLKLMAFSLTCGGTMVLIAAPLIFGVAFQNKFTLGQTVLPWTLTYCTWFGLQGVAQNWLWCNEKTRLASLAMLAGLATNVGLNLVLLPRLGLVGAVLATAVGNVVVLGGICCCNRWLGLRLDLGTRVALVLPAAMAFGPWVALAVLLLVAGLAVRGPLLLDEEKRQLLDGLNHYRQRITDYFGAPGLSGPNATPPSMEEIA